MINGINSDLIGACPSHVIYDEYVAIRTAVLKLGGSISGEVLFRLACERVAHELAKGAKVTPEIMVQAAREIEIMTRARAGLPTTEIGTLRVLQTWGYCEEAIRWVEDARQQREEESNG